jgi:hypothetical protein
MSIQPIMSSKQAPAMSTGYVAGMFSRNWDPSKTGFGLGIVNTATAEEYVMPFGKETILPTDVVDEVAMIQLPPGEYRIAYLITYSSKEMEQLTRTEVAADSAGGLPFTLTAGDVIFVGGHVTRRERNGINGNKPWMVHHQRLTLQAVQKAFLRSYPAFATQPVSCPSCLK